MVTNRKTSTSFFLVAALLVTLLHFLAPHLRWGKAVIGLVFTSGLFGLIVLNILLFTASVVQGLRSAAEVEGTSTLDDEQKQQRTEKILGPALQGDAPPPPRIMALLRIPTSVCLGIVVGSGTGWLFTWIGRLFL